MILRSEIGAYLLDCFVPTKALLCVLVEQTANQLMIFGFCLLDLVSLKLLTLLGLAALKTRTFIKGVNESSEGIEYLQEEMKVVRGKRDGDFEFFTIVDRSYLKSIVEMRV
jgi:hypothetical protein